MTVRLVKVLKGLGDRFVPGLQMKALGCARQGNSAGVTDHP